MSQEKQSTRRPALTPLMLALVAAFPLLARAAPDPCVGDDCTGRQNEGIRISVPSPTKPTGTLNVYALDSIIQPLARTPGIWLDSFAGYDLTLRTGSATAGRIGIVTRDAPGLYLWSIGQPPAPTPDGFVGVALPG